MTQSFRALSIRQPWLWAIFHAGKTVENRDWRTCNYRGPVLLHASKGCTRDEYAGASESIQIMREDIGVRPSKIPPLVEQTRGAIVGIARIVRADRHPDVGVTRMQGADKVVRELDWERGYLGYRIAGALGLQLADVRELPPLPFKGALGFFQVPLADLTAAYSEAWRELAAKAGAA